MGLGGSTQSNSLSGILSIKRLRSQLQVSVALRGGQVTLPGTVSRLNQKIYRHIEGWRNREIAGEFPYL